MSSPKPPCRAIAGFILVNFLVFQITGYLYTKRCCLSTLIGYTFLFYSCKAICRNRYEVFFFKCKYFCVFLMVPCSFAFSVRLSHAIQSEICQIQFTTYFPTKTQNIAFQKCDILRSPLLSSHYSSCIVLIYSMKSLTAPFPPTYLETKSEI